MKKNYNAPKVEKLAFNYTETVTASDIPQIPTNSGQHKVVVGTNHTYTKCMCWDWHDEWVDNC